MSSRNEPKISQKERLDSVMNDEGGMRTTIPREIPPASLKEGASEGKDLARRSPPSPAVAVLPLRLVRLAANKPVYGIHRNITFGLRRHMPVVSTVLSPCSPALAAL